MKEKAKIQRHNFWVGRFYSYSGANFYLDCPSMVFNVYINEKAKEPDFYKEQIIAKFPIIAEEYPKTIEQLFAKVIQQVAKMDLNLYVDKYSVMKDDDEWTIAFESLDEYLSEDVVVMVGKWFEAMTQNSKFDFDKEFEVLQDTFNKTLYGGPTIYSLVEAGIKKDIPVHYLYEENSLQWGYGHKQQRGRSTIFHSDGIKDTEFTTYKDMMGEFLELCNFPTPKGDNCFTEEEIQETVEKLGFPVVIKPVAGHKGQGVTTGIESMEEAFKAFNNIVNAAKEEGVAFEGALAQQQIYGYDHRILTVGGKFVACLKREPAFVIGDGKQTIQELIIEDNKLEIRADTARSPLAKIVLDADMIDYLTLQGLTPDAVPAKDEKIVLRRVANISAGGVSFNVTDEMHPENIKMAENIAKFFNVTALGIDVLAQDIGKPWHEGNFGIIEINAGPGVFMHLAPAFGGSVDVPAAIMEHFFGTNKNAGRIPIITGNYLTNIFIEGLYNKFKEIKPNIEFGSVRKDGVYFNNSFFMENMHNEKCKMLFRNPKLEVAVLEHTKDTIYDFGTWHTKHDIAILEKPTFAEEILKRDLIKEGILISIEDEDADDLENTKLLITLFVAGIKTKEVTVKKEDADNKVLELLEPFLKELLEKY